MRSDMNDSIILYLHKAIVIPRLDFLLGVNPNLSGFF